MRYFLIIVLLLLLASGCVAQAEGARKANVTVFGLGLVAVHTRHLEAEEVSSELKEEEETSLTEQSKQEQP